MVTDDKDYLKEFIKDVDSLESEEEDDEEEVDDDVVIAGENYYSSVRSFPIYEEEFSTVDSDSRDKQKYEKLCNSFSDVFFSKKYSTDTCYIIAKYLYYIKFKEDEHNNDRCKCLNYLLNTNEKFNTLSGYNVSKLLKAYYKLSSKFKTCYNHIEHIENVDVLGKIKKLYNLNKAMNKLEKSIIDENEHIHNDAEVFAEHYRNATNDCTFNNTEGFCSELKAFEQYIYGCINSEKHIKAWKTLKPLIPNDATPSIIVSFIMLLGIPLLLYILYKFTPLGAWANSQIQKKKKIWNIIFKNKSQLHNLRHEEVNMENSEFNIKYYSA
ncbi:PIR Superfamily Protein [Plasmodium ovale wallikeri]|uniref:PIR Superfamily Protein n=1 Tax=Plasmodium ovale wallikeri TaxID=864142 RepID=A0A1A9AHZ9_PLAOA|nr:PIR Superfamily Protein [Plasmodium ovale wallikeri]